MKHSVDSSSNPALGFNQVSVDIGKKPIWSDLSGEVKRGSFVAVLGPNGAGKSTLLKAILGTLPLSSGEIKVLGRKPAQANAEVGYLPQRRSFGSSVIRGIDLVRLGLDGHQLGLPFPARFSKKEKLKQEQVKNVIELVGATSYALRPMNQMSGGEQQRLLIAQALVRKPNLLLLDEPLDGLDISNQNAVVSLIEEICKTLSITVLMVAHDINPILRYLDQVIYMANGRALMGTPKDVITEEILSQLFNTSIEVLRTKDNRLFVIGATETVSFHGHG